MDEVADRIFVGTDADAADESLRQNRSIDIVVSLTHSTPETGRITRVDVPMVDGPQNRYDAFRDAVSAVVSNQQAGKRVLIHCAAGSSRSPSVAAAAIAALTAKSLNEAFNQVIERRPETDTAGCTFVTIFATPGWRIPSVCYSRQYEPHEALVRQAARLTDAGVS